LVGCLGAGALGAGACADGGLVPTSPSAHAAVSGSTAQSSSSPIQTLHLTKTCGPAIDHCTVKTSEAGPFPVGTDLFYPGPLLVDRTTSAVVLTTPSGDTAKGSCSLSYRSGLGTCALTSGTGKLVGLHANVKVSSDFESDPAGIFTWS